ncbi:DUF4334 domain-containing protein [Aquirhabdus parva]|uniref:DUF4334 domain-containing protein n=1 Tax=Aquirhabdus parva TaxID=2283318 RepID=A0A345P832_9GAMM|nr:DUF4334 domain-containing protein [Aquirhabdus parva]AXI03441.1 DUF4334 domain-containing protein [Aquirhabdus parva]
MNTFESLQAGTTTEQALALYDSLDPVDLDFMLGRWYGSGFPTQHRMDGLLEAYGWYGKEFHDNDQVDPMLFKNGNDQIICINPERIPLWLLTSNFPAPKSALAGRFFSALMPLLKTQKPKAHLRMTEFRGKVSATMIYNGHPIHDVFRKVDDNTLLGMMDLIGMTQPFFFVLKRD